MFNSRSLQRYLPAGLLVIALSVLYIFASIPYQDLFVEGQYQYYMIGMQESGHYPFLENDWYATEVAPMHPVFSHYVRLLATLNILYFGTIATHAVLFACMCGGFWLISHGIATQLMKRHPVNKDVNGLSSDLIAHITTLTAVVLITQPSVISTEIANYGLEHVALNVLNFQALASQYLYGNYLQPSEFGILALLAIGLLWRRQWVLSVILLALTTIFHAGFLIHGTIFTLVMAAWLFFAANNRRLAILITALYGLATLPIFIVQPLAFSLQPGVDAVTEFLTFTRIPHHNWPPQFMNLTNYIRLGTMILGAGIVVIVDRTVWRWLLPIGTLYVLLALILTPLLDSASLGLMQLWRGSVLFIPFSLMTLLTISVIYVNRVGNWLLPRYKHLTAAIFVVIVLIIGSAKILYASIINLEPSQAFSVLYTEIANETTSQDLLMVPGRFYFFRLDVGRAVYVDWKSAPYYPLDFAEWQRRFDVLQTFYEMPHDERVVICDQEGIDYYVLPIFAEDNEPDDWSTSLSVLDATAYELVPCTTSHSRGFITAQAK